MAEAINTYQEPQPENKEHVQEMLNKERQSGGEDRPDWLPEKFKSPEDMAKAYSELEASWGNRMKKKLTKPLKIQSILGLRQLTKFLKCWTVKG